MPDVQIMIGGRAFEVACQEGEEPYLRAAAKLLDVEASSLVEQIGRLPESRMLLMAGLMLADKTAALDEKLNSVEAAFEQQSTEIERLKARPVPTPERVEVPVIPAAVTETLAEIAARAESLADAVDDAAAKSA
ncbi:cell division protein ZapA [Rhodovulum iodosum]|uniref:Cell division protein ZapA n=1 Tax=Rhodovulum iodosum TaxID=68291 RepID=A0ABV3XVQ0_9RHOB|nr:cell division protein ZapA [Rhodovulum robiginosum]RSK33412.1 cell division protein ZapA [Rhodovulum robiginosum]